MSVNFETTRDSHSWHILRSGTGRVVAVTTLVHTISYRKKSVNHYLYTLETSSARAFLLLARAFLLLAPAIIRRGPRGAAAPGLVSCNQGVTVNLKILRVRGPRVL